MSSVSAVENKETLADKVRVPGKAKGVTSLRTQRVDVVASVLMAGLVVIGLLVLLLFVVWLTQTFTWKAGEIKIEQERIAGRGDRAAGFERDIEPPGEEEILDLTEPTLAETLEAVTESATSVAASVESVNSDSVATTSGSGRGDSRPPGPLGEGDDIVPRYERWEIKFQAKGIQSYASQLGFYKIELGCVGGGIPTVDYAFNLGTSPQTRSGSSADENKRARLFFMWRQENQLMQFDRQLLSRAGVQTQRRQILKFIPKDLEQQLYETEMRHAQANGHSSVKEIAKTIFESRSSPSGGYEFVVIGQRYRIPRDAT